MTPIPSECARTTIGDLIHDPKGGRHRFMHDEGDMTALRPHGSCNDEHELRRQHVGADASETEHAWSNKNSARAERADEGDNA
jgi:hypothetical protein